MVDQIDVSDTHEEERQIEVRQTCPGEDQLHCIVNEFELQCNLPEESLSTGPDPIPEYCGMDTSKQRAVEPPPPLRNELGNGSGNVGRGLGRLDVFEGPRLLLLCHDFETEDSVFSKVHVPLEQPSICGTSVHSLAFEVTSKGPPTIGAIEQGPISVGAKSSGEDGNVTEDALVCMRGECVSAVGVCAGASCHVDN